MMLITRRRMAAVRPQPQPKSSRARVVCCARKDVGTVLDPRRDVSSWNSARVPEQIPTEPDVVYVASLLGAFCP